MSRSAFAHSGIKGMHWGVRRFQNADGTRTEAGKKRYAENDSKMGERLKKALGRSKGKASTEMEPKAKSHKEMSNEELKRETERMNLERNYLNAKHGLASEVAKEHPAQTNAGEKMLKKVAGEMVEKTIRDVSNKAIDKAINKVFENKKSASDKKYDELKKAAEKAKLEYQKAKNEAMLKSLKGDDDKGEESKSSVVDEVVRTATGKTPTKTSRSAKVNTGPKNFDANPISFMTAEKSSTSASTKIGRKGSKWKNVGVKHYDDSNALYHHGVKGQKWGVRRYRDENGHLTKKGKERRDRDLYDLNNTQRELDKIAIAKKRDRAAYERNQKIGSAFFGAHAVIAGSMAVGTVMAGAPAVAAVPVSMMAMDAFVIHAVKHNEENLKKSVDKSIQKLESGGFKVSERPTEMDYTYNGKYQGKTKTKRYNLKGDTSPHKEDYNYTESTRYVYV